MTARAELERAHVISCGCRLGPDDLMCLELRAAIREALGEAEKMLAEAKGKWGHVVHCRCGLGERDAPMSFERDSRCAPETGGGE